MEKYFLGFLGVNERGGEEGRGVRRRAAFVGRGSGGAAVGGGVGVGAVKT